MAVEYGLTCRTESCCFQPLQYFGAEDEKAEKPGDSMTITLGSFFCYPQIYNDFINAARQADGEEPFRQFLAEHPDGAVDLDLVAICCPVCHNVTSEPDYTMYLPVDDSVKPHNGNDWTVCADFEDDCEYVSPSDLWNPELYKLYAKYEHKCENCGSRMEIIKQRDFIALRHKCLAENIPSPFRCVKCGKDLWFTKTQNFLD